MWRLPKISSVAAVEIERRVRFEHEDLDAVRMMIRGDGSEIAPGKQIEVEIGARAPGRNTDRIAGVWVPCIVIRETPRELVVRLL